MTASSPLTSMRMAWNVRRAGCAAPAAGGGGDGVADHARPARSVVASGRAAMMARAMRPAKRSSPKRAMSSARRLAS